MKLINKRKTMFTSVTITLSTLLFTGVAQAALTAVDIDGNASNGHEGVYDDVLDITWLANANIAASNQFGLTSGISMGGPFIGSMNWSTAEAFVSAMNAQNGGDGYLGVNTWRRPTATPVNGTNFVLGSATYDGSTDKGSNVTAPPGVYNPTPGPNTLGFIGSELAYHYYNNFEAIPECSGTGTTCVKYNLNLYGIHRAPDPNNYVSLFENIQSEYVGNAYWTDVPADNNEAIRFSSFWGSQGLDDVDDFHHLWVVAPGNVAASAVPLPAAAWLFGAALTGLITLRQHSRKYRSIARYH
ncbi:MAG: hypothetical protein HKO07_05475 [Pseudomonadales bacterium]|nr:hypothetical protein [Pseudomonadales bacterium]